MSDKRLRLLHLTFLGSNKKSSIEFGEKLTVIYGPSNTGKSFVVDTIDYMLGGEELRQIKHLATYSQVLLGIELPNKTKITIVRGTQGGDVTVHAEDVRDLPVPEGGESISAIHHDKNPSLSGRILSVLDLMGKRVKRNEQNQTSALSLRDLARLAVVGETNMQSSQSPLLGTVGFNKTREISAFRVLLEDSDDSALVATPSKKDSRIRRLGQVEVFDQLIQEAENSLRDVPSLEELLDQLGRLDSYIDHGLASIENADDRHRRAVEERNRNLVRQRMTSLRSDETDSLIDRFSLLMDQYESDLARLELVAEAGTLLGYFSPGTCTFCGAASAHQHRDITAEKTSTGAFAASVHAEIEKTELLRSDLDLTLVDLKRSKAESAERSAQLTREIETQSNAINSLKRESQPQRGGLTHAIETRSKIEASIVVHRRLMNLNSLRAEVNDGNQNKASKSSNSLSVEAVRKLSHQIEHRLTQWSFPDAKAARFDEASLDVIAGDQHRNAQGKGVRSILHAAFSLGFAEYCSQNDSSHLGFVVLDSPLITYKAPDGEGDKLPVEVGQAFYRDLASNLTSQTIVAENVAPSDLSLEGLTSIRFTANSTGRAGLLT